MNCAAIIMRTELSRAADAAMRREENGTRKNRIIYGNYNYTARTGTENNNMAKISGLGRGLENIFSDNAVEERNDITKLKITQIEPRSDQPRKDFDPESLAQLADSICLLYTAPVRDAPPCAKLSAGIVSSQPMIVQA